MKYINFRISTSLVLLAVLWLSSCDSSMTPEKSYNKLVKLGLTYHVDTLFKYIDENKADTVDMYLNAAKFKPSLFGENDSIINITRKLFLFGFTAKATGGSVNRNTFEVLLKHYDRQELYIIGKQSPYSIKLNPLQLAVQENDPDIVSLLLKYGANVNYPDQQGRTPLFWAINMDNISLIDTILNYNPNVNSAFQNITPLGNIFLQYDDKLDKYIPIVKRLIDMGANVNITISNGKNYVTTPLALAVSSQNIEMIIFLLKNGADPNIKSLFMFPITIAADMSSPEILKILLDYKADYNLYNKINMPAVFYAIRSGCDDCIKHLLEYGQSPFKKYSIINGQGYYSANEMAKSFNSRNALKLFGTYKKPSKKEEISNGVNYENFASVTFEGSHTCIINSILHVTPKEPINEVFSVDNYYHSCTISGSGEKGIQGYYKFSWSYYSQCINIGEPDGPYSYSGEFYIDGKYRDYLIFLNSDGSIEVKGID